jgi:hypothetical protein
MGVHRASEEEIVDEEFLVLRNAGQFSSATLIASEASIAMSEAIRRPSIRPGDSLLINKS